ncbi:unnamed protein product (macronuclear) [Paramecium tetraurelia]|uniref:Protein kinase domain-containing protein n=1 Tax=Paramecium tetraurelia TaxID=5888 RepID=A0DQN5_PARTE|nr:uncharacterized protein GSPATT00002752001 [Paramecium tetraurelia]CAK85352.1 unnamed protein product [Paramecium tetraurelia]|eukprot:XP_001452749.1 hypothetical protein (macronuclear) [Paramecium tetraurelia strain d4-2]
MGYCGSKQYRKDKQINKNNISDSQFQQYQLQNSMSQSTNFNCSMQQQKVYKKRDYKKSELIGKGSLFEVYQALDNKTGKLLAIKTVKIQGTKEQNNQLINQLKAEIKLLKQLKHKNIIQYYFTEISPDFTYVDIALEYISQGSLRRVLNKIHLEESNIRIYGKQILEGIQYLHKKNIVHSYIKTSTILVDSEGTIKLSNFKKFISIDQDFDINQKQKSPATEEEQKRNKEKFAIDILSLGAVIIEMFGGCAVNVNDLIKNSSEVLKPPYPQHASALSKNLLDIIFVPNHQQYSADKLLQHPFFNFQQGKIEFQLDDPNSDPSIIGSSFEMKKPFIQEINLDPGIEQGALLQNNKQRQQELEQKLQSVLRKKNLQK